MTSGIPSNDPDGLEVDLQHIFPIFVGEVFRRCTSLDATTYKGHIF